MKTFQYIGPFYKGEVKTIPADMNYRVVRIGFNFPDRWPLKILQNKILPDVSVNGKEYRISDLGILEFDELAETDLEVMFLKDFSSNVIMNISYTQMEEEWGV